jgi:hypothetical protein
VKAAVFYDSKGEVQGILLQAEAGTNPEGGRIRPESTHYGSLDIELDDVTPDGLAAIHSRHKVDVEQRKLIRR